MGKWQDIKMETPRERLRKRKQMELEKQKQYEIHRKKMLKIKVGIVFGILIIMIGAFVGFLSSSKNKKIQAKIDETKVVNVIPIMGSVDYRRKDEPTFVLDDNNIFKEGDALRLSQGGRARLDFGNDLLVTLRGEIELAMTKMEVPTAGVADVEFEFENGVISGRKPTGRGSIVINHKLAKVTIDSSQLTVFKVETKNFGQTIRIAVKDGRAEVIPQGSLSATVIPAQKSITIDNTRGFLDVGNISDINVITESWD